MMNRTRPLITLLFLLLAAGLGLGGCAPALVGVGTAAVAASSTEKGFSTSVSDTVIKAKIADKYLQKDIDLTEGVDVTVNDGSVLLTGKIETAEKKIEATRLAWKIKGVREVINEVQVTETSNLKDIAKDLAAAAQLRAKLIGDADISSLNYSIDVVNGIVYLSGVAETEAERERVIAHARELRFAKKVVNYILLSSDKRD